MIIVADASVLVAELLRERGRALLQHPSLQVLVAEDQGPVSRTGLQTGPGDRTRCILTTPPWRRERDSHSRDAALSRSPRTAPKHPRASLLAADPGGR